MFEASHRPIPRQPRRVHKSGPLRFHPKPGIAVIAPNTLTGIGLRTILERLVPTAEIALFDRFEHFCEAHPERFYHYFVAMSVFLRHSAFFRARSQKTILLGSGPSERTGAMHCLDITAGEERIVRDLLHMRHRARRPEHRLPAAAAPQPQPELSAREIEVLVQIARGLSNKQIAERLRIGATTVISHRRNLTEKLGIRSVAGLTLHALTMGYVDPDAL